MIGLNRPVRVLNERHRNVSLIDRLRVRTCAERELLGESVVEVLFDCCCLALVTHPTFDRIERKRRTCRAVAHIAAHDGRRIGTAQILSSARDVDVIEVATHSGKGDRHCVVVDGVGQVGHSVQISMENMIVMGRGSVLAHYLFDRWCRLFHRETFRWLDRR